MFFQRITCLCFFIFIFLRNVDKCAHTNIKSVLDILLL
jgi:hypothetical protein